MEFGLFDCGVDENNGCGLVKIFDIFATQSEVFLFYLETKSFDRISSMAQFIIRFVDCVEYKIPSHFQDKSRTFLAFFQDIRNAK